MKTRKNSIKIISSILALIMILQICSMSFASSTGNLSIEEAEYSDDYQIWLNLPDEEKIGTYIPNKYKIDVTTLEKMTNTNNVLKNTSILAGTASLPSSYDLRTILPKNAEVKDQNPTGNCWAFAAMATLENYLAMQDKKASKAEVKYDFSEKHLAYATTRATFLNGAVNEKGIAKKPASEGSHPATGGGNFMLAASYLTSGMGAIEESEMPFTLPYEDISLSEINNKTAITTLNDAQMIGSPTTTAERQSVIQMVKQHLMSDGGVFASIHGASIISKPYNNETGALYANSSSTYPANHAVEIVGWNDSYQVSNFNESIRPSAPGAFIIKNSWGPEQKMDLEETRKTVFENNKAYLATLGLTSLSQITNEVLIILLRDGYGYGNTVSISGNEVIITIGDNGYMYVSYEDANILNGLVLIEKAENTNKIKKVFQNEYVGPNGSLPQTMSKLYLANAFTGSAAGDEISSVGILTYNDLSKCKVYINPNGTDKSFDKLQLVDLQEGDYEDVSAGFHTIEFASPIKLTGSSFVVVIEVSSNSDGKIPIPVAAKGLNDEFQYINVSTGKSFAGVIKSDNSVEWIDFGGSQYNYVIPIRAYVTNNTSSTTKTLSSIQITTPPEKTSYNVGDAFDKTGMVVKANYSDGTSQNVTNYIVTNGTSLTAGQTSITVSYTEGSVTKTAIQNITVNGSTPTTKTLSSIVITKAPTKTTYNEGENFDATGMEVQAKYTDNTSKTITNYTVTDGTKLTKGKISVTISYTEGSVTKTTTQAITVKEKSDVTPATLSSIAITKSPTKTTYNEGENFDSSGMVVQAKYSDNTSKTITNYTVTDGTKLTKGKTSVTISYTENSVTKTTTQAITVREVEKEHPTLSDFSNSNAKVTKATTYKYISKTDKEDYSLVEIDLSGVKIGDTKSDRTFSYYLSTKKGETNIASSKWTNI
ncbi:MAG: bacterial Ig-like domain-containing protein [Clostridia bacterium]|nr:bacterial Ig-like domain-containing protein [Clostridia bacterium]